MKLKLFLRKIDFFTLLIFAFVILFTYLGFWQIDRAHEKKQILKGLASSPVNMTLKDLSYDNVVDYKKIVLRDGYWLPQKFIKKNVVKDNKLGAQVYGLYCQSDECMVVNFGWTTIEQLSHEKEKLLNLRELTGVIRTLPYIMIKEKMPLSYFKEYGMIVSLDNAFFSMLTGKRVLGIELLVDQSLTDYQQLTTIPKVSVERHYGYAIQFYLLALVLIIGYYYLK